MKPSRAFGLFVLGCFLLLTATLRAQSPATAPKGPPPPPPESHQFDFWLGEWEVFLRNGKKAGDSRIACVCAAPACVQSFRHCWRSFALAGRSSLQIVRVGKGVPICNTPAISV